MGQKLDKPYRLLVEGKNDQHVIWNLADRLKLKETFDVEAKDSYPQLIEALPTLLKSLGADWQGNRLGLGTVLFSEQKTLLEIYGHEGLNRQLSAPSERYNAFVCKN